MLNNQKIKMPVLLEDLGRLYPNGNSKLKKRYGAYMCVCGIIFKAITSNINNGHTKSCGCLHKQIIKEAKTTHGLSNHPLYSVWADIIKRTTNQNNHAFANYMGRGIKVCDEWRYFKNFYEDMHLEYSKGLTIDRIDVNGNYEPSNCRWTTQLVQQRNKRKLMSTNKSGYRGVSFNKKLNKWRADIVVNRKQIYFGMFEDPKDAAKVYDKYVIENKLEHTTNGLYEAAETTV